MLWSLRSTVAIELAYFSSLVLKYSCRGETSFFTIQVRIEATLVTDLYRVVSDKIALI